MLPLLSLHSLAAQRGDGLRPELKALLERHASQAIGPVAAIEPVRPARRFVPAAREKTEVCKDGTASSL